MSQTNLAYQRADACEEGPTLDVGLFNDGGVPLAYRRSPSCRFRIDYALRSVCAELVFTHAVRLVVAQLGYCVSARLRGDAGHHEKGIDQHRISLIVVFDCSRIAYC